GQLPSAGSHLWPGQFPPSGPPCISGERLTRPHHLPAAAQQAALRPPHPAIQCGHGSSCPGSAVIPSVSRAHLPIRQDWLATWRNQSGARMTAGGQNRCFYREWISITIECSLLISLTAHFFIQGLGTAPHLPVDRCSLR